MLASANKTISITAAASMNDQTLGFNSAFGVFRRFLRTRLNNLLKVITCLSNGKDKKR